VPVPAIVLVAVLLPALRPGPAAAGPRKGDPVVSQQGDRGEKSAADAKGDYMDVYADIQRAWKAGNVDLMLSHFGSQRVAISVEGTGPSGGTFSRNQSYYLLKDLFRYTITRKFEFTDYRRPGEEAGHSYAIAERHYQKSDDGRLFKDKVYVSLHLESDDGRERWVVDEIKSIR
jgi:hypothetical protein